MFSGRVNQRLNVLWKTASAVAGASVEKAVADARVRPDALANQFDVGTDLVGQVCQLVHETDSRGQHRVGCVLGELGRLHVHHPRAFVIAIEGSVELAHHGQCLVAFVVVGHAQHDAIGPYEILDGRAFLEKFGIADHREALSGQAAQCQFLAYGCRHPGSRADRHRGLVDHDLEAFHEAAHAARRRQHVLHVGTAILIGRRTDRDEQHVAMLHGRSHVG